MFADDGESVGGGGVLRHVRRDGAVHRRALGVVDGAVIVGCLAQTVAEEAPEEVLPHLRSEATEEDEVGQTLTGVTDALRGGGGGGGGESIYRVYTCTCSRMLLQVT